MTSISEDSEWEVGTTYQACQGTGVIQGLEEVPPRAQETHLGSRGYQEAIPHAGRGRSNLLLEAQVPLPIPGRDELSVEVTACDGTLSSSRSVGGR